MNCDLGDDPDQCRLISTTFFSPLLSFFFCNIFSETILFMPFSNVYFSQCGKHLWKMGTQYLLFLLKTFFVLSIVETSLLWILLLIFQKQNKFLFAFFFCPNVAKINSCVKDSPSQIFSKKNLPKTVFSFRKDLPFLIFSILFLSRRAFLQTKKKPDSLYFSLYCFCLICFSLYCFCLICCLFRVVSLCLLSLLLLF